MGILMTIPIKPILSGLDEESDWGDCQDYEDRVYTYIDKFDGAVSDGQFDELVCDVHELYDEYYRLYES